MFTGREARACRPLLPWRAVRSRTASTASQVQLLLFAGFIALFLQRRERAEQDQTVTAHQNGSLTTRRAARAAALTCWIRAISPSSLRKPDGQRCCASGAAAGHWSRRDPPGSPAQRPARAREAHRGQGHPVHAPAGVRGDTDELGSGLAARMVSTALAPIPVPSMVNVGLARARSSRSRDSHHPSQLASLRP